MSHRGKPSKKDKNSFGRAIIRRHEQDRREKALNPKLPASERLKSQLDSTSLEEFVNSAILSDRDFTARKEREDVILLSSDGLTQLGGKKKIRMNDYRFDFEQLNVPRRPNWSREMSPQELDKLERQSFVDWRRSLAIMEENDDEGRKVTPYEKNIEVWRQLWRVMERSDLIVQIVDARNPMFFFSKDLTKYAAELDPPKPMIILVNKSDFLTDKQRQIWGEYFMRQGWSFVFYSAHKEQTRLNEDARTARDRGPGAVDPLTVDEQQIEFLVERFVKHHAENVSREKGGASAAGGGGDAAAPSPGNSAAEEAATAQNNATEPAATTSVPEQNAETRAQNRVLAAKLMNRLELMRLFERLGQALHIEPSPKNSARLCVGMVGYPNVGKSSAINTLMGVTPLDHKTARVRVGATPGKTKHFQTLPMSDTILVCDCPGLVFPSFVSSTADMICSGVLPINQMRDHIGPITLICQRVPQQLLEARYNIRLPPQQDPSVKISAREFLHAYCRARVYYSQGSGQPDEVRASREILAEYVNGRLLHSHAPPGLAGDSLQLFQRETLQANAQSEKVRARLLAAQQHLIGDEEEEGQQQSAQSLEADGEHDGKDDAGSEGAEGEFGSEAYGEFDDDGTEFDDEESSAQGTSSSARSHTRKKRWGRKGKKLRNSTPYEATDEFGAPITYGARTNDKKARNKQSGQVFVRVNAQNT